MNVKGSILVVDDTPANLKLMMATLSEAGYEVRPVRDPRQALEAALREKPDLILLDIAMPDLDGYALCSQMKTHPDLRTVPVVLVSAQGEPLDATRAGGVGADDFIGKPVNLDHLLRVVTYLIAEHRA